VSVTFHCIVNDQYNNSDYLYAMLLHHYKTKVMPA